MKTGRPRKKSVTMRKPLEGDHGTGTAAAIAGTVMEEIEGDNPNNRGRRRRLEVIELRSLGLSMRQTQAAREIRNAWCAVEMLTSGGELKEQVDASPKPDAVKTAQISALSRYRIAMKGVPAGIPRQIVEAVCFHNKHPDDLPKEWASVKAQLKVALDLAANRLGY